MVPLKSQIIESLRQAHKASERLMSFSSIRRALAAPASAVPRWHRRAVLADSRLHRRQHVRVHHEAGRWSKLQYISNLMSPAIVSQRQSRDVPELGSSSHPGSVAARGWASPALVALAACCAADGAAGCTAADCPAAGSSTFAAHCPAGIAAGCGPLPTGAAAGAAAAQTLSWSCSTMASWSANAAAAAVKSFAATSYCNGC